MLSKTIWPNAALALCLVAGLTFTDAEAQTQRQRVNLSNTVSYIGVNIQEITAERAKTLKLKDEAGVDVTRVEPESPAEKAGVKAGDVITEFNSQHVEGIEQFSRMVRETPVGREVKLTVFRGGATQNIAVKIGSKQANPVEGLLNAAPFNREAAPSNVMPDVPRSRMSWRSGALGIEAESLSGQLAEFFGVKDGILIRSVTRGGAADKAGMRAGDVIVKVADSKVATPADVSTRLQVFSGKSTTVTVMRDKKEITLTVTLDNDRASRPRNRAEVDEHF